MYKLKSGGLKLKKEGFVLKPDKIVLKSEKYNIVDQMNRDPLLFQKDEHSVGTNPGRIILNNEYPHYLDKGFLPQSEQFDTPDSSPTHRVQNPTETGKGAVGSTKSTYPLPFGAVIDIVNNGSFDIRNSTLQRLRGGLTDDSLKKQGKDYTEKSDTGDDVTRGGVKLVVPSDLYQPKHIEVPATKYTEWTQPTIPYKPEKVFAVSGDVVNVDPIKATGGCSCDPGEGLKLGKSYLTLRKEGYKLKKDSFKLKHDGIKTVEKMCNTL